jgi:hypothetical protein
MGSGRMEHSRPAFQAGPAVRRYRRYDAQGLLRIYKAISSLKVDVQRRVSEPCPSAFTRRPPTPHGPTTTTPPQRVTLRVRPCRRNHYEFSNDYPDNKLLSLLPATATPATLTTRTTNLVALIISTTSIRQTVSQYTFTAQNPRNTPSVLRTTVPSSLPDIIHTVCRRTTSLWLRQAPGESYIFPTTNTR